MALKKILNYFKSPYFNVLNLIFLCLLGGTLTTFFPFNDFSLTYILRWKVFFLWALSCIMAGLCVCLVSLTWYWFDQPSYGVESSVWPAARYVLYGGVLPIILIMAEIRVVFGADFLLRHDMQYHLWFYASLIGGLNMYYRSVRLKWQVMDLKLIFSNLQKENNEQQSALRAKEEQLFGLKALLHQKDDKLKVLQNENTELQQKSTDWKKLYMIKIGNETKVFPKSDVGGFLIKEDARGKGGKPIIDMYLLSGESYIDDSGSLKSLRSTFPEFKSVTRQLLLSPKSINGYKEKEDGTVELYLEFLSSRYTINNYQWGKHKDWIKEIVDDKKAS